MNEARKLPHFSAETVPSKAVKQYEEWLNENRAGLNADQQYAADYAHAAIKSTVLNKNNPLALASSIKSYEEAVAKLEALLEAK